MQEITSTNNITKAAKQIVDSLAEKWALSEEEINIFLGNSYWKNIVSKNNLPQYTLDRISYLLGIYKALHTLLPSPSAADNWIKEPNTAPLFNGNSALTYMLSGEIDHLKNIKLFLDKQYGIYFIY
jgi:hypothetical protein